MIKLNSKTNQSNVMKLINIEVTSVTASLDSQKAFSKQILVFLKSFIGNVDVDSIFADNVNKFISDSSFYLSKINSNIALYNNLLEILDNIKFNCPSIENSTTVSKITQYNKKFDTSTSEILKNNVDIEKFIHSMSALDISEYISIDNLDIVNDAESADTDSTTVQEPKKATRKKKNPVSLNENTLIISETTGLVTLPYKVADLKKVLRNEPEKYASLSDIILSQYTVPLRSYRFSAISRFREAYRLVVNKEHGSKKEALSLATELLTNYNLHPAVIAACKNLNELDVYLSCLEFNELEDFHFFKIVYEALPVPVKKNKKEVLA